MTLSAVTSEVGLCNLAATHLKQTFAVQIDPPTTKFEILCSENYQDTRRAVLRAHPANFAIKRAILTEDTGNPPLFGFTKSFKLPNDSLRFLSRHTGFDSFAITDVRGTDFELEGRSLLLNDNFSTVDPAVVNIRYISDFTNLSQWDPLFIKLFAIELAVVLAPNFSSSEARLSAVVQLRDGISTEARAIDGQERPPTRKQHSRWLQARLTLPRVASPFTIFDGR